MNLRYCLRRPSELTSTELAGMFALLQTHYEHVSWAAFETDLAGKTWVILLLGEEAVIHGFSTQEIYSLQDEREVIQVLFSGDTIVEPGSWGSQELVRGWCAVAAQMLLQANGAPCYWFLISKGFRTYLYLPLFFKQYYPHHDGSGQELKPLLHRIASAKFPDSYDPQSGLIRFVESRGNLTDPLSGIPVGRKPDPAVRFFVAQNPDFAHGVELACLAKIDLPNTHGIGRRMLAKAIQPQP